MSIQKKSLISALKTTKKANVASTEVVKGENRSSMMGLKLNSTKMLNPRATISAKKSLSAKNALSTKRMFSHKKMA